MSKGKLHNLLDAWTLSGSIVAILKYTVHYTTLSTATRFPRNAFNSPLSNFCRHPQTLGARQFDFTFHGHFHGVTGYPCCYKFVLVIIDNRDLRECVRLLVVLTWCWYVLVIQMRASREDRQVNISVLNERVWDCYPTSFDDRKVSSLYFSKGPECTTLCSLGSSTACMLSLRYYFALPSQMMKTQQQHAS